MSSGMGMILHVLLRLLVAPIAFGETMPTDAALHALEVQGAIVDAPYFDERDVLGAALAWRGQVEGGGPICPRTDAPLERSSLMRDSSARYRRSRSS